MEDFHFNADWTFFATRHGKSPCDGIGGTVNKLSALASLQRPLSDQIVTYRSLVDFCISTIKNMHFLLIYSKDLESVRINLELRFRLGKTVPGTRSYHYFSVSSESKVSYKCTSFDPEFKGKSSFDQISATRVSINDCKPLCFVACLYDGFWWVGMILAVDEQHQKIKVNFMHPHRPDNSFYGREERIHAGPPYLTFCA